MYARISRLPKQSFFLFGPRGTGKTTWLKAVLHKAEWFNLLLSKEYQELVRTPESFRHRVEALPRKSWVVVDEVQKLPSLLDEVHALMSDYPNKYRFALTGSSSRKLKQSGVNLLAGRAINRKFFPLVASELGKDYDTDLALSFGTLPGVWNAKGRTEKIEVLEAYVDNYLHQEVLQEAAVKRLEPFLRFLEIAGILNAQAVNFSNIASDAGVGRTTVQGYFSVVEDTLLGSFVPAWRPKAKVKEVNHPKFYFFDPGVARAVAHRAHLNVVDTERGFLLETLVLAELRAWNHYLGMRGEVSYWRTPSQSEVDFVFSAGKRRVAIEIKASERWKSEYGRAMKEFKSLKLIDKAFGVYLGKHELKDGPIRVLPVRQFLRIVENGDLL